MTSLEKLLIQGIRSFDPQNNAVIEFYKPLTLIVGQNGAGKTVRRPIFCFKAWFRCQALNYSFTISSKMNLCSSASQTIIECLKYSCTGQLPPDAQNGKAWIHDTTVRGFLPIWFSEPRWLLGSPICSHCLTCSLFVLSVGWRAGSQSSDPIALSNSRQYSCGRYSSHAVDTRRTRKADS
jgi:hypothetical protein